MTLRKSSALVILGTSTMFATESFGQQAASPVRPGVQVGGQVQESNGRARPGQKPMIQQQTNFRGAMQAPVTVHQLASCLAIENQEEVVVARFASERTKRSDVKDFAKMLVDDHEAFLKKLQRFAPEATRDGYLDQGTTNPSKGQAAAAAGQGNRQIQQTAAQQQDNQSQGQGPAGVDAVQLHREVAQECIANAKRKMTDIDEDKFDHCFIGHQIAKHEAMKTQLAVLERHTSGEFAQVIADGAQATEKHLKQATKIMEKLDADRDSKSSRRSERRSDQ